MQRFRRSALLVFAAGTVVLAAACGSGGGTTTVTAGGNKNTASSKVLTGAGSTLVYPLVSQWEPDYATKDGVTITYGAIGSRRRDRPDHRPRGRLRRQRRAALGRPGHGMQGLPADPLGARRRPSSRTT